MASASCERGSGSSIGWDRVLFATDYPHWDYDDPAHALPIQMDDTQRRQVFLENAKAVYGVA